MKQPIGLIITIQFNSGHIKDYAFRLLENETIQQLIESRRAFIKDVIRTTAILYYTIIYKK